MKTWQRTSLLLLLVNRRFKPHPLVSSPPSPPSNLVSPLPSCVTKGLLRLSPASDSYYSIQTHLHFFLIVSYSCHCWNICYIFHNSTPSSQGTILILFALFYHCGCSCRCFRRHCVRNQTVL